jgi:DNA primase
MNRIPEETIQRVIERTDIVDVVSGYVTLTRKGGRYWGCCPFHNEKTPSFSVDGDKGFFYCFGCQKGGNVISFLQEIEKFSFVEAIEAAAKKAGIEIVRGDAAPEDKNRTALLELYRRVASSFQFILSNKDFSKSAKDYLLSRGLTAETIEVFQLGFAPPDRHWLHRFLRKKGYSAEFLEQSGLFSKRYPEISFFSDRIIFPIMNSRGEIVAFGGRTLSDEGPKYLNSPDSPIFSKSDTLFGLWQGFSDIRKSGSFMLVEGYMDAISLHQAGVKTAIAPLGTSFTENQARLLKRYAQKGILLFDSDAAGQKATRRAITICEKAGISSEVVVFSSGKDASEILQKFGADTLQKLVKSSINSLEYLVNGVLSLYDINTVEGKTQASKEMFSYIETLDSEVKRDASFSLLAERLRIDRDSLIKDYSDRKIRPVRAEHGEERRVQSRRMNADMFFVLSLVVNRGAFPAVRTQVHFDDLEDRDARSILIALEECYRNDETDMESLLKRLGDDNLRSFVLEKSSSDEFSINAEKLTADGLMRIKIKNLENRQAELQRRMIGLAGTIDEEHHGIDELIAEKVFLDNELRKLKGNGE